MAAGIISGVFGFLSQPQDQFEAAQAGSISWFEKQQQNGKYLDVDKVNQHDQTALYVAARNGHLPVVKFLVQQGADVNAAQKTKSTPLHAASYYCHYQVVEYLVACGCNCTIKNSFGLTAAQETKDAKIKQIILNPKNQKRRRNDDGERFTLKYMPTFNSNPIWMFKNSHWLIDQYQQIHGGGGGDSDSKENKEEYVVNQNVRLKIINNLKQDGFDKFAIKLAKLNKNWNNNYDSAGNIETWNQSLIRIYTEEDGQLYKKLNKDIAKQNKQTKLREYAIGLHHALESFPDFKGTCYRSVRLPHKSVEKFQNAAKYSQFIQLPAFSSCSKSKDKALNWGGDGLLVIEVSNEPVAVQYKYDKKNDRFRMVGHKDDEKDNNQLQLAYPHASQPSLIKVTEEQLVLQNGAFGQFATYQKEETYVLHWSNNNNNNNKKNTILGTAVPTYGKDISKFSAFPIEEEVLFTFENVFFCKSVSQIKNHHKKKWQIVLELRPVTFTDATFDVN